MRWEIFRMTLRSRPPAYTRAGMGRMRGPIDTNSGIRGKTFGQKRSLSLWAYGDPSLI